MKAKRFLAVVLASVMVLFSCSSALASYTQEEIEAFGNYINGTYYTDNEIAHDQVAREVAEESYVLLKNDGVLPIAKSGKIALFGNGATGTMKGGIGSGIVNMRERDWIDTAFADAGYEITTPAAYSEAVGRGSVATGFLGDQEAVDVPLTDEWIEEAKAADTAIYVIARTAGEGADRQLDSGNGAWYLTEVERANIEKIAASFENVIVILNTYVTDVSWLQEIDNIDAVLHIGYGGQRTGATTLNVLNGTTTPSGKTNATWAWDLDDYLSSQYGFSWMDGDTTTEYYKDGIYVGYRYFDTFGLDDEVAFPFGYGLSYTDFDINVDSVDISGESVDVTVTVTNTGDTYAGKEVVQVYFSAPDGTLEKPYQELAAFAKTKELQPGEQQTLTISYDTTDMSSYSEEQAAYIMEAGDYIIRVGNSSRNTHVAAVATLAQTQVTEQLSNQFALEDGAVLEEISKEGATPITYEGEADEIAQAQRIELADLPSVNNASPYDDETITTYLFAEDFDSYEPTDELTLKTANVAGILNNRPESENSSVLPVSGSGRYVKVFMTNPALQYVSIYEISVMSGDENVAAGKTVTAISSDGENAPELITDGDTQTRWSSALASGDVSNYWVTIDLGDTYDIDGVSILFESAYARNLDIQVSDDNEAFTTIATAAVPGDGMSVNGGGSISGYSKTTYSETKAVVDPLPEGMTKETVKLTDVLTGKITLDQFVASLSAEEMANLVHATGQGSGNMGYIYDEDGNIISYTHAMMNNMARTTELYYDSRHIPALGFTDGPAGVRCDNENQLTSCPQIFEPGDQGGTHYWSLDGGLTAVPQDTEGAVEYSVYPTAFPGATNISCTWNPDMMYAFGKGVGEECREYNVNAWLAPGMNIVRNPMCGRNFEYFSEDPYLTGICGAYVTAGVQSNYGVGVTIKHYWGNNQEDNRGAVNNVISERAAREIYLKGYEIAIKLAQPMYMMTSYNENNGWPSADAFDACTDVARGEWGFKGAIMTDWNGGQSTPHISMHAGNDLICPGKGAATITDYLGVHEPTFDEDGNVHTTQEEISFFGFSWTVTTEYWGTFVPEAGGEVTYEVEVADKNAIADAVWAAVANGKATVTENGDGAIVTWYGFDNAICLGDLQKAAKNILGVMLYSQDMEILCNDLGIEPNAEYALDYSEAMGAPIPNGDNLLTVEE